MNENTKPVAFFIFLVIVLVGIVGYRFENYYIAKDYTLNVFTPCDPTMNSCFVADPDIADPAYQGGPYEKVTIVAHYAPLCLEEHTCVDFSCAGIQGSCSITYCSSDVAEAGENCSSEITEIP